MNLGKLNFLNRKIYEKIVYEWNNTRTDYPQGKTIADLFEEQVEKTPDSVAIVYEGKRLSYRELNEKANRLANYLIKECGVVADDIITLCLDRSELMIISILGVLKSGAAYAPMSPDYPKERLEYIISDTKTKAVITKDTFNEKVEGESAENPVRKTNPNNLAYVIYTSGTTGLPKGVMVEHHSAVNLLTSMYKKHGLIPGKEVILFSTNYVFDPSIEQIFFPLLHGDSMLISNDEFWHDDGFIDTLIKEKVTYIDMTPSLLQTVDVETILSLRHVISGGEALPAELFNKLCGKHFALVNAYGPTETTVTSIANLEGKSAHIGRPITNATAYILDNKMRPVPVGAVGELHIGGACIARGYLNKPELTAEKFIANPFQTEEEKESGYNGRLYKTGDLAKYLSDGNIEYLGRNDFQVKIRGFRVELSEVENAIEAYSNVKQCVVIDKERNGEKYLAAYYVGEALADDIRTYLASKLPEYMVPAAFVKLEQMPLTVNGKIDRNTLPEPDIYESEETYEAPANEKEAELVKIFAEALGTEADKLSVAGDFFRLGGSSITAIKLANRIQRDLGLNIKVSDIFAWKSVREIANQVMRQRSKIVHRNFNNPEEQKLSYAQDRLWFIENYEGGSNAYNVPLVRKIKEGISVQNLKQAVYEIVRRHEILRSVIKSDAEGKRYQEVLNWREGLLEMPEEQLENANELESKIIKDFNYIFNLNAELPIRVKFYNVEGKQYLSIVAHHIAFDGWSHDIFMRELSKLHDYYQNGGEYPLSELAIQYKDYAAWQLEYLQGDVFTRQLDYWKQKLAGYETLNLLTDKERPAKQQYKGGNVYFEFDLETSARIRKLAKELGVSVYTVMLSAYYLLLSAYSGQKDIVLGTVTANRGYEEISDIIGFFVNTLAMRQKIDWGKKSNEFIREVGKAVTEAERNGDAPFDLVVNALGSEIDRSLHPIFQVAFSAQENLSGGENLFEEADGKQDSRYEIAKFDLLLSISEGEIVKGAFNYATSLFNKETIERYAKNYLQTMKTLVKGKEKPLSEIAVLSDDEYELVAKTFSEGRHLEVKYKTVAEWFCATAEQYANSIALETETEILTYRELYERAQNYANELTSKGLGAGSIVDFCLPRTAQGIVAHLGIALSGAAFLPLDPKSPQERRDIILSETRTAKVSPNAAYILYTSGTTGKPKGAVIPQHALVNQITWAVNEFGFNANDKILHYVAFTFDPSVLTLFASLCSGATLSLLSEEKRLDPLSTARHICDNGVSVCILPAAVGNDVSQNIGKSKLRLMLLGGEVPKNLPVLNRKFEIINSYGPTETCVTATFYKIPSDCAETHNIGNPVANTQLFVLDDYLKPCPIGARGELYIGGAQLALGYLNRPNETAAAFINHHIFGKLYKTGDMVFWNADGELEFVGRADGQVKIRGNRIELGEIESVLCNINGILDAKVKLSNGALDAYAVVKKDAPIINAEFVRQNLSKKLPSYMLPRTITIMEAFPLTQNGKVDLSAFPKPIVEAKSSSETLSETETLISDAWKSALKLPPDFAISRNDNFYNIGGHSLLLFHIVGLLSHKGLSVNIKTLVEHPVLADLANIVDKQKDGLLANQNSRVALNEDDYSNYLKKVEKIDLSKKRIVNNVLITGATGFLGSYLVQEYYKNTNANIYLPVRGNVSKLKDALVYYFGNLGLEMFLSNRVRAYLCDISEKALDIDVKLDVIFHSAADIRHYAPEIEMYKANVTATENMLAFAKNHSGALFAHISTLSAVNLPIVRECDAYLGPPFENVYSHTKQTAELRVFDAMKEGLECVIFRVGSITPSYENCSFQRNWKINGMLQFINIISLTELLPENDYDIGYSFVDKTALALRLLTMPANLSGMAFHIDNSKRLTWGEAFELAGYNIKRLRGDEIVAYLQKLIESSGEETVRNAAAKYLGNIAQSKLENIDAQSGERNKLRLEATLMLLKKVGFEWPEVTAEYFQNIINKFRKGATLC